MSQQFCTLCIVQLQLNLESSSIPITYFFAVPYLPLPVNQASAFYAFLDLEAELKDSDNFQYVLGEFFLKSWLVAFVDNHNFDTLHFT